jgi:hypothetical protein
MVTIADSDGLAHVVAKSLPMLSEVRVNMRIIHMLNEQQKHMKVCLNHFHYQILLS